VPRRKRINPGLFRKLTPNLAYVLGFFAADGNLSINKRGGCYFSFHSKDRQIIIDIRNALSSDNKVSKRVDRKTAKIFYRLQLGSKEIVQTLQGIGFSTNKTRHLPFLNVAATMISHFVRGYFDGDGNIWQGEVHKKRKTKHKVLQLAFTSGAYGFLSQLKCCLHELLGTEGSHVLSKIGPYSRLQYSTKDALKIYDFMYNTKTPFMCLKRKKRQFDKHILGMRP